mgnify:CR=1 FL=1
MKALVYTRVSTLGQKEGYSLETQRETCEEKAREMGASEIIVLEDTFTGIALERPALKELRELVFQGQVQMVVAYDPDRLSRNLADLLLITNELDRLNVNLYFVNFAWESTPLGRLFLEMRGAIAEFEHSLIRERTLRGKRKKAESGKLPGYVEPYGYRFDTGEDLLVINEEEAKVVKYIYSQYNKGLYSGETLANILNRKGILAPKGTLWYASTVLRVLANPTYLGLLTIGDYTLKVPSLVTEEEFQQARIQRQKNQKGSPRRTKREYLLQKVLFCGNCGEKMKVSSHVVRGKDYAYYICPQRLTKKCHLRPYPVTKLDMLIWQEFLNHFNQKVPSLLQQEEELVKERSLLEIKEKTSFINKLHQRQKRLLELLLAGVINEDCYREELISVEISIEEVQEEIAFYSQLKTRDFVAFNLETYQGNKQKVLELFIDKVELFPKEIFIEALV